MKQSPLRQRGSSLPVSKPFGLRFNHENTLKSFCGLKGTSSVCCKLELFFSGKESIAALWASFVPNAQNAKQNVKYHLQPQTAYRVAVLGVAGQICQPLALLIKMSPLVSDLHLFDIANVKGVAADLSHCNTPTQVRAFGGAFELGNCLKGMNLVVIPAGVPRKPGMTLDDLFTVNAGIVRDLVSAVVDNCPNAFIHIIRNPVNSTMPVATEVLKQKGVYDPKKLFGVTTLDVVRANTFVAQKKNLNAIDVDVPVVGGHAGITILRLLSGTKLSVEFSPKEVEELIVKVQNVATEVVEAKGGAGSATLLVAYVAGRFVEASLRALDGDDDVYECCYVDIDVPEISFFTVRVNLEGEELKALLHLT